MDQRTSAPARILAAAALAAAVLAVIVVVAGSSGGDSASSGGEGQARGGVTTKRPSKPKTQAKTYVIKSGDTLEGISEKTGVSVEELQTLNPEIDPQILIAGETLTLR